LIYQGTIYRCILAHIVNPTDMVATNSVKGRERGRGVEEETREEEQSR
jgi:hypothetical protein